MKTPDEIIELFYSKGSEQYDILYRHSLSVRDKALSILDRHPEIEADRAFVGEAAMLHDVGIFMCNAPDIHCYGNHPYICHGYLGADLLRAEGMPKHALVAERHTGTGLSSEYIRLAGLPLPEGRIYEPQSIEEKLICYADKFFSKTHLDDEKSLAKIEKSLSKKDASAFGRFMAWHEIFG